MFQKGIVVKNTNLSQFYSMTLPLTRDKFHQEMQWSLYEGTLSNGGRKLMFNACDVAQYF